MNVQDRQPVALVTHSGVAVSSALRPRALRTGLYLRFGSVQGLCRCDDGDVLEVLKIEQIFVPGDDEIGAGRDGERQHGIIIRVAAHGRGQGRGLDHFRQGAQLRQ